jgi:hypothetical protein
MMTLTHLDLGKCHATDISVEDILAILSANHIPLTWVDCAYTYGLHYINHHYTSLSQVDSIYQEIDEKWIHWLSMYSMA